VEPHPLLRRQLRQASCELDSPPSLEQWRSFVDSVQHAYATADRSSKTDFLANMSHELRTPLNAILGFGRVLERSAELLPERQQRYVTYIVESGEHMLQLVNDLLDLRISDERALQLEPVDLLPVVHEVTEALAEIAQQKGIRLSSSVLAPLPLVLGERRSVLQVLINLLSNAIKFTPTGGEITVSATERDATVVLAVQDSGVGIAPHEQPQLFTYFEQVGAKHGLGMKGSGIGLALTRSLMLKQGGSIAVHSVAGQGSTFEAAFQVAP